MKTSIGAKATEHADRPWPGMFHGLAKLLMALAWAFAGAGAASGGLLADYRFQNGLSSSVVGGSDLVNIGSNTFNMATIDGVPWITLNFAANNGLLWPGPAIAPDGNYSVAILFEFNDVSGCRRTLDFKNGAVDNGLYNCDGALTFYTLAGSQVQQAGDATMTAHRFSQIVLTRDDVGNVVGYVDGYQEFAFFDFFGLAVMDPTAPLIFFHDSGVNPISPPPTSSGAFARVRIYDETLPYYQVQTLDRLPPSTL